MFRIVIVLAIALTIAAVVLTAWTAREIWRSTRGSTTSRTDETSEGTPVDGDGSVRGKDTDGS